MLPELETERLTLREIALEDGLELQAYQTRRDNWCPQAVEPDEYTDGKRIERYLQYRGEGDTRRLYVYVARLATDNTLVGEIGLSRTYPATVALGFSVASEHWSRGYATEMARHMIAFGFDTLNAHRITAAVATENLASRRVLEKIGMTHEGTSRACIHAQNRWWDEHQFAILATDPRLR